MQQVTFSDFNIAAILNPFHIPTKHKMRVNMMIHGVIFVFIDKVIGRLTRLSNRFCL